MSTPTDASLALAPEWIALGVAFLGAATWFLAGFRPVAKAWMDGQGQRIQVKVRNLGRTGGLVESVTFLAKDSEGRNVSQQYTWFRPGVFSETVGSFGVVQFIAQSVEPTFRDGTIITVTTKGRRRQINPVRLGANESWELNDVLPSPSAEELKNDSIAKSENGKNSE